MEPIEARNLLKEKAEKIASMYQEREDYQNEAI
jgi:hypothetical protein